MEDSSPSVIQYRAILLKKHKVPWRGRLYPGLQWLCGRPLGTYLRRLHEWEQLPRAEFEQLHAERLRTILEYAHAHVPLYRSPGWSSALSNGDAGSIDHWPLLGKETLRAHFEDLRAQPPPRRILTRRTSGTTGSPTKVAMTPSSDTWGWAHRYRGLLWHGIPIGVPSLRLSQDRRVLRDLVKGEQCLPSLDSPQAIDQAISYLTEKRPVLVAGPPSTLFLLARHLRERGVTEPLAEFARVGGEQLFRFQRNEIESFLCARVINSYGSTETGALAGECPAGSLHVYADHVHLEIFNGDSPAADGEVGEIVVTSLRNTAMPLVRYPVGDRGRLSRDACRCGLPQPVLTDLQARSRDMVYGADGGPRHASELAERLDVFFADPVADGVRQVRFHQQDTLTWEVWMDVADSFLNAKSGQCTRQAVEHRLAGLVRETLGAGCDVTVHIADEMPRGRGKFRYFRLAKEAA
jgi:phenylacetate-CoA ligase